MIPEIYILSVGKNKEPWLLAALEEYEKRLQYTAHIHWLLYKNDADLEKALSSLNRYIALDLRGKMFSSEQFSSFIADEITNYGKNLHFVIGSSEGLTLIMRKNASRLISLSPLTFTHQMTRLVLLEQLYRAFEIARNSPYHK